MTDPKVTSTSKRSPRRYLDPEVAAAIRAAKERTSYSFRELADLVGVSHSHLVLITQAKRVPSVKVSESLSRVLSLSDAVKEKLISISARSR